MLNKSLCLLSSGSHHFTPWVSNSPTRRTHAWRHAESVGLLRAVISLHKEEANRKQAACAHTRRTSQTGQRVTCLSLYLCTQICFEGVLSSDAVDYLTALSPANTNSNASSIL